MKLKQRPFLLEPGDKRGKSIKTKHFVFHPHNYGISTLMRVGFKFAGRQLLLHHFRPHTELEFHDHPWPFRTVVLWGSYVDESPTASGEIIRDVLRPFSTRRRPALHAHRTHCKRHVWTFVLTGRKERRWCKGTPETWVCEGEVQDFDETLGMVKV
jgi:hypothetical protein